MVIAPLAVVTMEAVVTVVTVVVTVVTTVVIVPIVMTTLPMVTRNPDDHVPGGRVSRMILRLDCNGIHACSERRRPLPADAEYGVRPRLVTRCVTVSKPTGTTIRIASVVSNQPDNGRAIQQRLIDTSRRVDRTTIDLMRRAAQPKTVWERCSHCFASDHRTNKSDVVTTSGTLVREPGCLSSGRCIGGRAEHDPVGCIGLLDPSSRRIGAAGLSAGSPAIRADSSTRAGTKVDRLNRAAGRYLGGWARARTDAGTEQHHPFYERHISGFGGLGLGYYVSPNLSISGRLAGLRGGRAPYNKDLHDISHTFIGLTAQYWLTDRVWMSGGLGLGVFDDQTLRAGLSFDTRVGFVFKTGSVHEWNVSVEVIPTFVFGDPEAQDNRDAFTVAILLAYQRQHL